MVNKIGATGESVEQFEIMKFFERQSTLVRFMRISHKGRILQKRTLFIKYSSYNYAPNGSISKNIGATGGSVEQFEVT